MRHRHDHMRTAAALIVFFGVSIGVLIWDPKPWELQSIMIREGGIVESLSAALWLIAAAACLLAAIYDKGARIDLLLGAFILTLFGARELDLQVRLFDWNLERIDNYWNPSRPMHERLLVLGFFVLPSILVIAVFITRQWNRFWTRWREGVGWPREVVTWLVMLVVAIGFDKSPIFMSAIGVPASSHYIAGVMEECFELAFAFYTLLVLWPLWRRALGRATT